jgi:DNA-binding XRE family transcriptional regulator
MEHEKKISAAAVETSSYEARVDARSETAFVDEPTSYGGMSERSRSQTRDDETDAHALKERTAIERSPDRAERVSDSEIAPAKKPGAPKTARRPNNLRKFRDERLVSKAELARRANLSVLTIDRVEKGFGCRMATKRKILEALGLTLGDRVRVFGEDD